MKTVVVDKISKKQIGLVKALLSNLKMTARNKDLVYSYTGGRETSTAEMSKSEAGELITYLQSLDNTGKSTDRMRKKIIAMAHEMGWKVESGVRGAKSGKVDMARVDGWCVSFGRFHKPLNDHTYLELTDLVTQFEVVLGDWKKRMKK